ncbi:MAG: TrmH family RNA methyltransferase, partial [Clostridia bacterium]
MHIVLYQPEIPQNTGNIARTCAATGCTLHLIKPLGFSLEDKYLKRAGLDYWNMMEYHVYEDFEALMKAYPN